MIERLAPGRTPGWHGTAARLMTAAALLAGLAACDQQQGVIGADGPTGPAGLQGVPGPSGPQGPQGIQGEQGPQGVQGEQGVQGLPGEQGPAGAVGAQGPQGLDGLDGAAGPQGTKGIVWQGAFDPTASYVADDAVEFGGSAWLATAASTGEAPPSPSWSLLASMGATGATGADGPQGPQGPAGVDGAVGPTGPRGLQGAQGIQGNTGATGATGPSGPQGLQGAQGQAGVAGPQGLPGEMGPQGLQGIPGEQGPQGLPGVAGATGAAGPSGPQGPQGEQGLKGLSWLGAWDGLAVYGPDDVVQYGGASYVATAITTASPPPGVEWSLLAARGEAGPQGEVGPQGLPGPQGAPGAAGATGATGDTGPAGPMGLTWRGTWSSTTAYASRDAVQYDGSAFVALQAALGAGQSPASAAHWDVLAAAGATGAPGSAGATGATGPAGPQGPSGPQGPAGAGGAFVARDANGVTLGVVMSLSGTGVTVLTSTGHQILVTWSGGFSGVQIFWSGAGCTGTPYFNAGGATVRPAWGKQAYYSLFANKLYVARFPDANGQAFSTPISPAMIENPGCVAYGSATGGWELVEVSRATIGLPASIATPLAIVGN